ncbi:MAG: hypothetical protein ACP5HK_07270 [Acidilobus sp.]
MFCVAERSIGTALKAGLRAGGPAVEPVRRLWHLRLLYRLYPADPSLPEYRIALDVARRYGCRRVVDVGAARCNLGRLLLHENLVNLYVGLDLLDLLSLRDPRALCVMADARSSPLRGHFDCAFFVNSLFYASLDTLHDYAKVADVLMVTDIEPTLRHPLNFIGDLAEGRIRLTYRRLGESLESMGFKVLESRGGAQYYYVISGPRRTSRRS